MLTKTKPSALPPGERLTEIAALLADTTCETISLVTALQSGRGLKTSSYRTHAEPISYYAVFPRPESQF